jgi:hypothetical protein
VDRLEEQTLEFEPIFDRGTASTGRLDPRSPIVLADSTRGRRDQEASRRDLANIAKERSFGGRIGSEEVFDDPLIVKCGHTAKRIDESTKSIRKPYSIVSETVKKRPDSKWIPRR